MGEIGQCMLRIAVIGNSSDTLIKFRLSLLKLLSKDHIVYAVCPSFSFEEIKLLGKLGIIPVAVSFDRFALNPLKELSSIFKLCRFFIEFKIDVSLCYFIKPVIYGTLASFIAGVKRRVALVEGLGYFFTWDTDQLTLKKRFLRGIIKFLFNISLPLAHKVIFLNKDDETEIKSFVRLPLNTYILGGIGVDLNELPYSPKTQESSLTFITVARILREKGIIEYLNAASFICNKYSNIHFWILGPLDQNPGSISFEELNKFLTHPNMKWFGPVNDVKSYIKKADVFVLPSYREGVPRSTQEAMALGKPVITTDVQGCRETVVHSRNGLLVRAKSVESLVEALEYFIQNREVIPSFGYESRLLAEERFDSLCKDRLLLDILIGKNL